MIKLTPTELQSIINAAMIEISKHPNNYKIARPKAQEIYKWLISEIWDDVNETSIMIDELPF